MEQDDEAAASGGASTRSSSSSSGSNGVSNGAAANGAGAASASAAPAAAAVAAQQAAALQPVTFTQTRVLAPQPCWQQAAAALRAAVAAELPRLAALSSGVVRWEVPLPRGCSAARWLRGQDAGAHYQVYFAGRHSTAPETPKSALAEASARGWSAAAGLGAAWLWRGAPGAPFGDAQLTGVQRMLSEAQPRIRVLGGTRWVPHGSAFTGILRACSTWLATKLWMRSAAHGASLQSGSEKDPTACAAATRAMHAAAASKQGRLPSAPTQRPPQV